MSHSSLTVLITFSSGSCTPTVMWYFPLPCCQITSRRYERPFNSLILASLNLLPYEIKNNPNKCIVYSWPLSNTIAKFRKFDFHVVRQLVPDVIILELGSNDLVELSPQTVGSEPESLVRELYEIDSFQFVVVGQVLRRHTPNSVDYNCKVGKLHQYLKVVSFIQWILAACTNAIINISVYCLYIWYNGAALGINVFLIYFLTRLLRQKRLILSLLSYLCPTNLNLFNIFSGA